MDGLEQSAVKTYRYLRLGVVGMALALGAALVIEIATGDSDGILGSISAYYYTPVTGVFVGVLVAVGFSLIAIKGREGAEDIMLNLAGMLAPIVALVPTPISEPVYGLDPSRRAVPEALVPTVENNVGAVLILGVIGLAAAYFWLPSSGEERRVGLRGLAAGAGLMVVGGVGFVLWRQEFLDYGHYVAAISMFALLAAVAVVNAMKAPERAPDDVRGLAPTQYRWVYAVIAIAMGLVIVVAVAMFAGQAWFGWALPTGWLFVVEALLLLLFSGFWLAQTFENWKLGSPVADAPTPVQAAAGDAGTVGSGGPLPEPA